MRLLKIAYDQNYSAPQNPQEMLFDFYMFSAIVGAGEGSNNYVHTDKFNHLQTLVEEGRQTLMNALQDELLQSLFYSICSEFRFAVDRGHFPYKTTKAIFTQAGQGKQVEYFRKEVKLNGKDDDEDDDPEAWGDTSFIAANKYFRDRLSFVKLAASTFSVHEEWQEGYGGNNWAAVCDGWLKLAVAKKNGGKQQEFAIDHTIDLVHNNGVALDKVESYTDWISSALDFKRDITNPWQLYQMCSPQMKSLASIYLHFKGWSSFENYSSGKPSGVRPEKYETEEAWEKDNRDLIEKYPEFFPETPLQG